MNKTLVVSIILVVGVFPVTANALDIEVDVMPGSCPNPIDLNGEGILTIAILGTEIYDVAQIDFDSIEMASQIAAATVKPNGWAYPDVATPFDGELCDCHTLGPDGYLDLILQFDYHEVVETLGLAEKAGETVSFILVGSLLEEFGGDSIHGLDCVLILPIPETCINVTKTVEPTLSMVGAEVLYTIDICNCGDFDITITDILDSLLGPITIPTECESLVVGECCTITIPYTIQPDDPDLLENEVCVTAVDDSGETVSDCSTATVGVVHPKIEIEKTVDKTDPWYGYTVTYGIFIENTGDWPLDIIVMDSLLGDILHPFVLFPDETWYEEFPYVVQEDAPCPLENCAEVLCIPLGLPNLIVDKDCVEIYPEPPGGEGCVPGFWKKNADNHGASAWCDRFSPSDPFSTHFSLNEPLEIRGTGKSTITNPVLLQALEANGGGVNAMIRHGVAAMLNACSDCVNYEISDPDQVIMMIEDTLNGVPGTYTIDELHSMFAEWNEAGCSVDQHGDCVD